MDMDRALLPEQDWSSLSSDALGTILEWLPWSSHPSFAATCKHWRSAVLPFYPAWLTPVLFNSDVEAGSSSTRYYSPYYHKNFHLTVSLNTPGARICCACGHHLALRHYDDDGKIRIVDCNLVTGITKPLHPSSDRTDVNWPTDFDIVIYDHGGRRMFGIDAFLAFDIGRADQNDSGRWSPWKFPPFDFDSDPSKFAASPVTNPVLHCGMLYLLGADGRLAVYDDKKQQMEALEILDKPKGFGFACDDHDCYLFESDEGELMAVLIGYLGSPAHLVRLNEETMEWEKVESLKGRALFTGALTTMMVKTDVKWMTNKVFVPRLHHLPENVNAELADRQGELAFVPVSTAAAAQDGAAFGSGIWTCELGPEECSEFWETTKLHYSIWVDFRNGITNTAVAIAPRRDPSMERASPPEQPDWSVENEDRRIAPALRPAEQRDWSSLPDDVLEEILKRLPRSSDPSFAATCKDWRSVESQNPRIAPALLFECDDDDSSAGEQSDARYVLYSIPTKRRVLLKGEGFETIKNRDWVTRQSIPTNKTRVPLGEAGFEGFIENTDWVTRQGWVLTLEDDGSSRAVSLRDPFSSSAVQLPPDREGLLDSDVTKCYLSTDRPTDPDCVVLVAHQEDPVLFYCRPGDRRWSRHEYQTEEIHEDRLHAIRMMSNLTAAEGKFHGRPFPDGKVVTLKFSPEPKLDVTEVAERPWPPRCNVMPTWVIESCGELFMVRFCHMPLDIDIRRDRLFHELFHVEVDKLDMTKRAWVKVERLGDDRAFFVNRYQFGVSMDAKMLGLQSNCIYFTKEDAKALYVYNMERGTITMHNPDPNIPDSTEPTLLLMPVI